MSEDRDLYQFFSGLRQVVSVTRNVQRRLDRALASEFSLFDQKLGILRSQTAENQLSNIFRFLLDPTAAHGQGRAFLDAFIRATGLPGTYGVVKSVTRDFPTNEGRLIDIVMTFDGQSPSAIGIENKPWYLDADGPFDLPNQVRDYCVDLNRAFPAKWAFICLERDFHRRTTRFPLNNGLNWRISVAVSACHTRLSTKLPNLSKSTDVALISCLRLQSGSQIV
jgi:PD-(D/E)XK nuclease superfamily